MSGDRAAAWISAFVGKHFNYTSRTLGTAPTKAIADFTLHAIPQAWFVYAASSGTGGTKQQQLGEQQCHAVFRLSNLSAYWPMFVLENNVLGLAESGTQVPDLPHVGSSKGGARGPSKDVVEPCPISRRELSSESILLLQKAYAEDYAMLRNDSLFWAPQHPQQLRTKLKRQQTALPRSQQTPKSSSHPHLQPPRADPSSTRWCRVYGEGCHLKVVGGRS